MWLNLGLLIISIIALIYSSKNVVKSSKDIIKSTGVSAIFLGLIVLAIGSSLPEFVNAISSSVRGYGNIHVANCIGSNLTNICLVIPLAVLFIGSLKGERSRILKLSFLAIIATIIGITVMEDGEISRIDGLMLVIGYFILLILSRRDIRIGEQEKRKKKDEGKLKKTKIDEPHEKALFFIKMIGNLIVVIIAANLIITAVTHLSSEIGIPEYFLSFFLIAIGTSLPELAICLESIKEGEYELAASTILGSNMINMTFVLAAGPLLNPVNISRQSVTTTGIYTLATTMIFTYMFAKREKIDKKRAIMLLVLYAGSFMLPFLPSIIPFLTSLF